MVHIMCNHMYVDKDESNDHVVKEHNICDNGYHDWVHDIDGQGAPGAVHISSRRRKLPKLNNKKKLHVQLSGKFQLLCA